MKFIIDSISFQASLFIHNSVDLYFLFVLPSSPGGTPTISSASEDFQVCIRAPSTYYAIVFSYQGQEYLIGYGHDLTQPLRTMDVICCTFDFFTLSENKTQMKFPVDSFLQFITPLQRFSKEFITDILSDTSDKEEVLYKEWCKCHEDSREI